MRIRMLVIAVDDGDGDDGDCWRWMIGMMKTITMVGMFAKAGGRR